MTLVLFFASASVHCVASGSVAHVASRRTMSLTLRHVGQCRSRCVASRCVAHVASRRTVSLTLRRVALCRSRCVASNSFAHVTSRRTVSLTLRRAASLYRSLHDLVRCHRNSSSCPEITMPLQHYAGDIQKRVTSKHANTDSKQQRKGSLFRLFRVILCVCYSKHIRS